MNKNKLLIFIGLLLVILVYLLGFHKSSLVFGNSSQNFGAGGPQVFFSTATSTLETVATSNTIVLATSTGRTWAEFSNNSAFPVFCRFDNGALAANNTGFIIVASSTFKMNQLSDPVYTGAVNCIAQGGSANFYVEANQ